jgi:methyl-accepting chemotaxis protein PixJ
MEQRTAAVQKQPDHTALIVPSVVRGQVIGAIGVHAEAQREWTKEEMDILGEIAERMAITADNLRLVDATQRRAAREQLIGQVTARMRESLDVEKVLQIAAREFGEALGLTEVYVSLEKEPRNTQDDGK